MHIYNNKCAFSIYVHVYPVIIKEHYVHVLFIVNVDIYVRFYVLICVFRNPVNTVLFSPHVWPFYRSKLHDGILPISKFPQRVSVQANKKENLLSLK